MNEQLRNWHPTPAEVKDIVREMRPLNQELARREHAAITTAAAAGSGVARRSYGSARAGAGSR